MRALYGGSGPHWQLKDVEVPEPGPEQVLVRVRAAALNNADLGALDGDEPYLAGYEFAGETSDGRRVMGTTPGAFAECIVVDHRHIIDTPDGLEDAEAAALPTGLLTEHGALTAAGFRAGQRVLVTGATSAIGLIGLQVARALGAETVVGTSRSDSKRDLLLDNGATDVAIGTGDDLQAAIGAAFGDEGPDVVLDHVGGETFAVCVRAVRDGGSIVNIGRLDSSDSTIDLDELAFRHLTLRGVSFGFSPPETLGAVISFAAEEVESAIADGHLRPVIDRVYEFADAPAALERLRDGAGTGKLVLKIG